jgi:hypothetical protein
MDTKTLVVGQDVYLFSGCYWWWGKVVEVTPEGVDVVTREELVQSQGLNLRCGADALLRFNNEGKGRDEDGTYECGAWNIDDMPFAERKAWLKPGDRK